MSGQPTLLLELTYNVEIETRILSHKQRLRCRTPDGTLPEPGEDAGTLELATTGIGGAPGTTFGDVAAKSWIDLFVAFARSNVAITSAVYVAYPDGLDSAGVYVAPVNLDDATLFPLLTGQDLGSSAAAHQITISFYDGRGKISRIQFMECTSTPSNTQTGIADAPGNLAALATFASGSNSWILGAGNSTLMNPKLFSATQNEAVYRKRYRG